MSAILVTAEPAASDAAVHSFVSITIPSPLPAKTIKVDGDTITVT